MKESTENFLKGLERGELRAATYDSLKKKWNPNVQVKEQILEVFKEGQLVQMGPFVDKHTLPLQTFTPEQKIRIVPGGSSVRRGAYLASGVVVMPPSYINIGAYIDTGTMVDSHVLVGSCAQVGKRVHLSTAVQIGGVLEPIGQTPVIIEDDAFLGAGVIVVEGIWVQEQAVLAPGVILSQGTPIFDATTGTWAPKGIVPVRAVVVMGTRPHPLYPIQTSCAVIIKYRDSKTIATLALEEALRS